MSVVQDDGRGVAGREHARNLGEETVSGGIMSRRAGPRVKGLAVLNLLCVVTQNLQRQLSGSGQGEREPS